MNSQSTNAILMIRPAAFRMNEQTAINNYYQQDPAQLSMEEATSRALHEFDTFAERLIKEGIKVQVIQDSAQPSTPDAIFPNNWISFHQEKEFALYPMFAENRRQERRPSILEELRELGFDYQLKLDLSSKEKENKFLEGTGSLVLDRVNKIAYAALSPRTDATLIEEFCTTFSYQKNCFRAYQNVAGKRKEIYHTNAMMCIASKLAIVCLECIDDENERKHLRQAIEETGKILIEINEKQVEQFAGNMLELKSSDQQKMNFMVMSSQAYKSLTAEQIDQISKHLDIVHSPLELIEQLGGGSARCMIAELF